MAPRKRAGGNPNPGYLRNRIKARRNIAGGGTAPRKTTEKPKK